MKPIFLLDNFDSFTYNLVDELRTLGHEVRIYRNSIPATTIVAEMEKCAEKPILILSPGPGNPSEAGCLLKLIELTHKDYPIIGICLGHQAICQFYGASIVSAGEIIHGKVSEIKHNNRFMFEKLPNPMPVARYHSLVATNVPEDLIPMATFGEDNMIMSVVHKKDLVVGFQFHPESIMTADGSTLLAATIDYVSRERANVPSLLEKLYANEDLTKEETMAIFNDIFSGEMDPIVLGSALTAFKQKTESVPEIAGAATAMVNAATPFNRLGDYEVGEIVGTGGDKQNTINISSMSAIVASSLGLHVAKHGNRSVSSKTGASDLLGALGINIRMTPAHSARCLHETNLTFLFAPIYHKGMKYAVPVRKALGTRTIFNILGPLTNPAKADYQLIGVYSKDLVIPMVNVLKNNGVKRAIVAFGSGLDEIATHGETYYAELKEDGSITEGTFTPADFGLDTYTIADIRGGEPEENKEITLKILQGQGTPAQNAAVAANAGTLLYLGKKVSNVKEGAALVLKTLKEGTAYNQLQKFIAFSNEEL